MQIFIDGLKYALEGGFWHFIGCAIIIGSMTRLAVVRITVNKHFEKK